MNDTAKAVAVWRCSRQQCRSARVAIGPWDETFPSKLVLNAGETTGGFNISRHGAPNVFLVRDPQTGRRLGCFPFVMPHYVQGGLTARVPNLVPCRSGYDEDVQWPS